MRQHLSQYPARQVPDISGPYALDLKSLDDLAEDRLDAIAPTAQPATPLRLRVTARRLKGRQHLNALLVQSLFDFRLPIIAVAQAVAFSALKQLLKHRRITEAGGRDDHPRNYTRPSYPHVQAEAVEGLLDRMIFAVARLGAKALAALRPRELADRHREANGNGKVRVAAGLRNELLPQRLFDFPEVGRLTHEGRAVDQSQGRKEVREVAAEISEDGFVLAEAEKLADDFHGQDLAVGQTGLGAALAQGLLSKKRIEGVVNQAKDRYNKGIQVQGERPPIVGLVITIEDASPWTFSFHPKTCTSRY